MEYYFDVILLENCRRAFNLKEPKVCFYYTVYTSILIFDENIWSVNFWFESIIVATDVFNESSLIYHQKERI